MSHKGMMDGWEPEECRGQCGKCPECEQLTELKGDQQYESYRYEQLDQSHE